MIARLARLWRYNYTVLMGGGYWILVLPAAASQVVTLWMMALQSEFSQGMANNIAELMTPILGAFLVAHSVAPEYRSGIGSVLACKPVSLHRVVTIRIAIAMILPILLTFVTLTVCSLGIAPVAVTGPLLASLPPLFFLSMFALTAATLFRSALAGFAASAVVWGMDLYFGYAANPLLSSRGYSALEEHDPLATFWLAGKVVLLVLAVVLLLIHSRLLPRVCRPAERQDLQKLAVVLGVTVFLYCVTGASTVVAYAYLQRGELPAAGAVWLRRQLGVYGPVPVARLYGPAFGAFLTTPPNSVGTDLRMARIHALEDALKRWPNSYWADCVAYNLGEERENIDPVAGTRDYFAVADRYSRSPLAPRALVQVVRSDKQVPPAMQLAAARRLLHDYPRSEHVERAAAYLFDHPELGSTPDEKRQAVQEAAAVATELHKPRWLYYSAELYRQEGRADQAVSTARQALEQAAALQRHALSDTTRNMTMSRSLGDLNEVIQRSQALISSGGKNVAPDTPTKPAGEDPGGKPQAGPG